MQAGRAVTDQWTSSAPLLFLRVVVVVVVVWGLMCAAPRRGVGVGGLGGGSAAGSPCRARYRRCFFFSPFSFSFRLVDLRARRSPRFAAAAERRRAPGVFVVVVLRPVVVVV